MIKIFQRRIFHKAYDGLCTYICASKVKKPSIFVKANNVCTDALEGKNKDVSKHEDSPTVVPYLGGALNLENIALFDKKELFEKP